MSHPLSKCFVYLFKIYLVYTDTSSAKLGKDNIVALAFEQDYEILTPLCPRLALSNTHLIFWPSPAGTPHSQAGILLHHAGSPHSLTLVVMMLGFCRVEALHLSATGWL